MNNTELIIYSFKLYSSFKWSKEDTLPYVHRSWPIVPYMCGDFGIIHNVLQRNMYIYKNNLATYPTFTINTHVCGVRVASGAIYGFGSSLSIEVESYC